ncbi:hypothetical protein [Streptosporangium carneum]|uniref:Uncharacterized protein n=1 Tax=Streptosporangium carneum TaxID=47481 RepID=A0A9W6MI34_9ACTN|nr:hypothetical protein [Streptosporangium carneum]GLK14921.1 hypothetical protein GCM10017600_83340 [Streptosporangium carneum]
MSAVMDRYDAALDADRRRFAGDPAVEQVLSPSCDGRLFARWTLRFNAHGVHMTHDVAHWISAMDERCCSLGTDGLDRALRAHSRAAAKHDRMMAADARATAAWWHERHGEPLDAGALLAAPPLTSAEFYAKLHENVLSGPAPFCWLAVEYEIGRLSAVVGPALLANCRRVFGASPACYGFLAGRVEPAPARAALTRRRLETLMSPSPSVLDTMVKAGKTALAVYAAFAAECWDLAQTDLRAVAAAG